MVVESCIHRVGVEIRGNQAADVGIVWHAGKVFDLRPGCAAIVRDVDEAVVGAGEEKIFVLRRFRESHDVAVKLGGGILRDRIGSPDLAHDG